MGDRDWEWADCSCHMKSVVEAGASRFAGVVEMSGVRWRVVGDFPAVVAAAPDHHLPGDLEACSHPEAHSHWTVVVGAGEEIEPAVDLATALECWGVVES